jgi:hypothetical protein
MVPDYQVESTCTCELLGTQINYDLALENEEEKLVSPEK